MSKTESSLETAYDEPMRRGFGPFICWDFFALVLPLAMLVPLARSEWAWVVASEERQFVPLLVGFVVAIVSWRMWSPMGGWSRAGTPLIDRMTPMRSRVALTILIIALLIGTFAWRVISPWSAYVAGVGIFFGWALGRYRFTPVCSIVGWLGLLLVTVRFPAGFDTVLTTRLQGLSAWGCDRALDALWIPHLRMASIIEIPQKRFFVEEACSGVSSLFSLLAFAAVSLYLRGASLLAVIFCLLAVPFWAVTGNFFRLLAVTAGYHRFGLDLTTGPPHEWLGIGCFLISLLGYLLTEGIVRMLLMPVTTVDTFHAFMQTSDDDLMQTSVNRLMSWPKEPMVAATDDDGNVIWRRAEQPGDVIRSGDPGAEGVGSGEVVWRRQGLLSGVAAVILLVFGQAAASGIGHLRLLAARGDYSQDLPDVSNLDLSSFPKAEHLPERTQDGWQRIGFKQLKRPFQNPMGQHSLVWEYSRGDDLTLISLDFPYRGQHALEFCYHYAGWEVTETRVIEDPSGDGWPFVELTLRNDLGFAAHVCYATFSDAGQPVNGERGLSARLKGNPGAALIPPICFQVQLFRETAEPLNAAAREGMGKLFASIREGLLESYRSAPWDLKAREGSVSTMAPSVSPQMVDRAVRNVPALPYPNESS